MINSNIIWPIIEQKKIRIFDQEWIEPLYQEMFGSLSDDPNNPLSRVSVANSSFSLDPVKWCPLWCAYCVVWSNTRDLNLESIEKDEFNKINYQKLFPKKITKLFEWTKLMEALTAHPAFLPDQSVISIGTWSSEAFLWRSSDETASIIEYLIRNELKNPVRIVTKVFIPPNKLDFWIDMFHRAEQKWIKVILSITYSWAPKEIEPYQEDRFQWVKELKNTWIHISHHLRPIIKDINDSPELINKVLKKSMWLVDSICVGWLRADPWLILSRKHANNLDIDLLPNKPWEKDMPDHIIPLVKDFLEKNQINIPIFWKSSQVISYAKGRKDYNLYEYRKFKEGDSLKLLSFDWKDIEYTTHIKNMIMDTAKKIWINIKLSNDKNNIYVPHKLSYQVHRSLIHAIWHTQVL